MVSPSGPRIFNGSNTKDVHFYSWPMGCFLFSFSSAINSGFWCLKIFFGIWLIYNVVLVTGVQKSESVLYIYIHISTLFQILFLHRPLQRTEQSLLCYTVGPHQLSILYIAVVYVNPKRSIYPSSLLGSISLFSTSVTPFLFYKYVPLTYWVK